MRFSALLIVPLFCWHCTQQEPANAKVARRVGDRIVQLTKFDFKQVDVSYRQEGIYTLYLQGSSTGYDIKTNLETAPDGRYLAFAANPGFVRLKFNGKQIFSGNTKTELIPRRLDYDRVEFENQIEVPSNEGLLEIDYTPLDSGLCAVFIWFTDSSGEVQKNNALKIEDNGKVNPYVFKAKDSNIWLDPVCFPVSKMTAYLDMTDWRYFSGIMLDALWQVSEHYSELDYRDFVRSHMKFFTENIEIIKEERQKKNLIKSPFGHYFRYQLLDDFGTQTIPYLTLNDEENHQFYVDKALQHTKKGSLRLADGTFCRNTPDSATIWADDLFMGTALLSRAYTKFRKEEYLDEAIRQTIQFDHYLKDPKTGLYWHGYFANSEKHSASKWARANGWTMMAKTELLLAMPQQHNQRAEILRIFREHAEAIRKVQSNDGRWHQVLDNQSTYLETSSTAMFVRAFAEGTLQGWLDKSFLEPTSMGWNALLKQIDEDGNVEGIVKGTPILFSDEAYENQKTRLNDPRGLGAILYANIAVDKLTKKYPNAIEDE